MILWMTSLMMERSMDPIKKKKTIKNKIDNLEFYLYNTIRKIGVVPIPHRSYP